MWTRSTTIPPLIDRPPRLSGTPVRADRSAGVGTYDAVTDRSPESSRLGHTPAERVPRQFRVLVTQRGEPCRCQTPAPMLLMRPRLLHPAKPAARADLVVHREHFIAANPRRSLAPCGSLRRPRICPQRDDSHLTALLRRPERSRESSETPKAPSGQRQDRAYDPSVWRPGNALSGHIRERAPFATGVVVRHASSDLVEHSSAKPRNELSSSKGARERCWRSRRPNVAGCHGYHRGDHRVIVPGELVQ